MAVFFPELWCVDDLFEGYFVIVVIDLCQLFFTFDDAIVAFRLYAAGRTTLPPPAVMIVWDYFIIILDDFGIMT